MKKQIVVPKTIGTTGRVQHEGRRGLRRRRLMEAVPQQWASSCNEARQEGRRRQRENCGQRVSALALIDLRWDAGVSDLKVAKTSGLGLEMVRRPEALAGPFPSPEDVARYRSACGAS